MPPMIMHEIGESLMGGLGLEMLYSFVIIVCSLMVFFGTKELYELSSHKGIKYFRYSFLFFAIAYFVRSFIKLYLLTSSIRQSISFFFTLNLLSVFLFMLFSSLALLYLLYGVMWKKWKTKKSSIYMIYLASIVISAATIIYNNVLIYLLINLLLIIFIISIVYVANKKSNKRINLYIIYILLSVFWVLNILDILIPTFLRTFQFLVYLASIGVFLLILYKVLKKSGSN